MSGRPLHVAVVSRHQLTRAGLTALLANHPDRALVVDVSRQDGHLGGQDVAIYDLAGFDSRSHHDLEHLVGSNVPVVAITPHGQPELTENAFAAGVAEVISPDVTVVGLLTALERAAARRSPTAAERADLRIQTFRGTNGLTEREAEILILIGAGFTNQEIAEKLYLSINSIKSYIRSSYAKIGAKSRSQAVLWVFQNDPSRIRNLSG